MIKNDIGINAGIIWQLLSEKEKLSLRQIGELTGFKDSLLMLALGWLARENKIRFLDEGSFMIELNIPVSDNYY